MCVYDGARGCGGVIMCVCVCGFCVYENEYLLVQNVTNRRS